MFFVEYQNGFRIGRGAMDSLAVIDLDIKKAKAKKRDSVIYIYIYIFI